MQFDRQVRGIDVPYVGCDNVYGMSLIADHVRSVTPPGQPIIYVGATPTSSSGRERMSGFTAHFPEAQCFSGRFDMEWGQSAAQQVLDLGIRRATLVAAADVIALGMLGHLLSAGHRIPEDFRVIGFDGVGVASYAQPQLTTVRQPVDAMSSAILDLLQVQTTMPAPRRLLEPTLIVGASSPATAAAGKTPLRRGNVGGAE